MKIGYLLKQVSTMSVIVKTKQPHRLVKRIKELIDNNEIDTWEYDSDGDFTHSPDQWHNHCWMHPHVTQAGEEVVFAIIGRIHFDITTTEYAVYHGRFIEMLLSHFDTMIRSAEATSMPTKYDIIKASDK